MKTAAATMFGTPESTREIAEHRDKTHSQALNFAPLSTAIFSLFEPLRAARSKFRECGSAACEQAIKFKAAFYSRALKFYVKPSQIKHEI